MEQVCDSVFRGSIARSWGEDETREEAAGTDTLILGAMHDADNTLFSRREKNLQGGTERGNDAQGEDAVWEPSDECPPSVVLS